MNGCLRLGLTVGVRLGLEGRVCRLELKRDFKSRSVAVWSRAGGECEGVRIEASVRVEVWSASRWQS